MNRSGKKPIWVGLCLCLVPQLFFGYFFHLPIAYLAPVLIFLCYRITLLPLLWVGFSAGLLLDLLAAHGPFGLITFTYTAATGIIYSQRHAFFFDKIWTLPAMTALFSITVTILEAFLLPIVYRPVNLSFSWIASDLVAMPLLDSLYALVWFYLPMRLFFGRPEPASPYKMARPK